MGGTHSAPRGDEEEAAAEEEESVYVDAVQNEEALQDTPAQYDRLVTGLSGGADDPVTEALRLCEDKVIEEVRETSAAVFSLNDDVLVRVEQLEDEEALLGDMEMKEKESQEPDKAAPPIEMEAKMNQINGFMRFFSYIGLKLTFKKSTGEKAKIPSSASVDKKEREPSSVEEAKDAMKESTCQNEQDVDLSLAEETPDNDSTACPTATDVTSEDIHEEAEEKNTESIADIRKEDADDATATETVTTPTSVGVEDTELEQDTPLGVTSPSGPDEEEAMSPIKMFFRTGRFSSLRRKKRISEQEKEKEEMAEKELADVGAQEDLEQIEETENPPEQVKEEVSPAVEDLATATSNTALTAYAAEVMVDATEGEPALQEPLTVECALQSSQEKVKAQDTPFKRMFSGSKKKSKRQRGRKSSDTKLTDSFEHVSDNHQSSTEVQTKASPEQSLVQVAEEESSGWASFKKLITRKKLQKRSPPVNEEAVISGTAEEPTPNEQELDVSAGEAKRRKGSSVSWEDILCGSGKKSQNTTDAEDDMLRNEGEANQPNCESNPAVEMSHERDPDSHSSPEQAGSSSEGDGGSTWKSLKKLVIPKRKCKDEDDTRGHMPVESETSKDESSASKNFIPGHESRKAAEPQDQPLSGEAERLSGSKDEEPEMPAVVPLSEFDALVTEDQVQMQAVIESHSPPAEDHELKQHHLIQTTEPVLPCDDPLAEPKRVPDEDNAVEDLASTGPASSEEFEDLTEIVSKHQQLSDIPEEGVIEESVTTPASIVVAEAARDDTIAEDVIELMSEAVTAAEPVDFLQADETEMISAVSQLTDSSSKTSGNMTPVPAEHNLKDTDTLLHHVIETISVTSDAVPMSASTPAPELIVGSVSTQILDASAQQRAAVLGAHQKKDAVHICVGLSSEEFDAIKEVTPTAQTECVSEVTHIISTEVVFEETTEEPDTAEMSVDEVIQVSVSQPQENVRELQSAAESQPLVECESEVKETVSTQPASEGDLAADQTGRETEALSLIEDKLTNEFEYEEQEQTAEGLDDLQTLTPDQEMSLKFEEGDAQLSEKQRSSEDIPPERDGAVGSITEVTTQGAELAEVGVKGEEENQIPRSGEAENEVQSVPAMQAASEEAEEVELEKPVAAEDAGAQTTDKAASSVAEESNSEAKPQVQQALEIGEGVTGEVLQDIKIGDEDRIPEVVPELAALTTVHVTCLSSEASTALVLEKEVVSEVSSVSETENVTASVIDEVENEAVVLTEKTLMEKEDTIMEDETCNAYLQELVEHESQLEVSLPELGGEGEREDPLPAVKVEVAEAEHAPAVEAITWSINDVTASMPDTAVVTPTDTTELLVDVVASELESQQLVESVSFIAPLVTDYMIQEAGNMGKMMHMALGLSKDDHGVQVQTKTKEDTAMENEMWDTSRQDQVEQDRQKADVAADMEIAVASITNEPIPEMHLPVFKVEGEGEEELPAVKIPEVVPELAALTTVHVTCLSSEASTALVLEKEVVSEVSSVSETENVTASVIDEVENEAVVLTEKTLMEKEDTIMEDETCNAYLQDRVEHESQLEVSLPELGGEGEREDPLPAVKTEVAEAEHAPAVEAITWSINDVTASMPDTAVVTPADTTEPLVDVVASELESQELVESVSFMAPLVTDYMIQEASEGPVAVMMHMASSLSEDDHMIQVQTKEKEDTTMENETCSASLQGPAVHEDQLEVSLPEVKGEGEREVLLPAVKVEVAEAEHAPAMEAITWSINDVTASMPDTAAVTPTDTTEPLVDVVASELESQELVESVSFIAPLVTDDLLEKADEGHVAAMMHMASSLSEDDHRIQVQMKTKQDTTTENETFNAFVQDRVELESQLEISLPAVGGEGEREDELPAVKMEVAEADHEPAMETIACSVEDVTASMPDTPVATPADASEPLVDVLVTELESQGLVESVSFMPPAVTDDLLDKADEGHVPVMMHMASSLSEDDHRVQVQTKEKEDTTMENETCDASQQVHVGLESHTADVEVQEPTTPHFLSRNTEANTGQMLDEHVVSKDDAVSDMERGTASVTDEPKLEMHLPEIQVVGEREDELSAVQMEVAEAEHGPAVEAITCSVKDVTASMPDTAAITTSDTTEPLVDVGATEQESQEVIESVSFIAPVVTADIFQTAVEGRVAAMMQMASDHSVDNHRIQLQTETNEDTTTESETCDASLQDQAEHESQAADVATEGQAFTVLHSDSGTFEANDALVVDKHFVPQDDAAADMENTFTSIVDEPKPEIHFPELKVEGEGEEELPAVKIPEVVPELAALTTVHVTCLSSEASTALVLEKEVVSEVSSVSETENVTASVIDEVENEAVVLTEKTLMEEADTIMEDETCSASLHELVEHESQLEVSLPELLGEGQREVDPPAVEMDVAEAERAPAVEAITCSVNDGAVSMPDTAVVTTSDTTEPLLDVVASELESQQVLESASFMAPVVTNDVTQTAAEGSVAVMTHVASALSEEDHRIQVQFANTEIASAEAGIETVPEVGVSAATERIDFCHEIHRETDDSSATLELEEEVTDETSDAVTQQVIQQEKERLPEVLPESGQLVEFGSQNESVALEPEAATPLIVVSESSETTASGLLEVRLEKVTEDHPEASSEGRAEEPSDAGVDSATATEQRVFEHDSPLAPVDLEAVSIQEPGADNMAQDSTCTFKEVAEKMLEKDTEDQRSQATSHQVVRPGTPDLAALPNTGVISAVGHMGSPSGPSLEFKQNIPFEIKSEPLRQTNASEVSIQTTEKIDPVTETEVITCPDTLEELELIETGTQAIEAIMQLPATGRVENQQSVEVSQEAVWVTEGLGLVRQMESTEMAVIVAQPLPSEVASQAVETVKPVKTTESSEKALILTQPAPPEVGDLVMETEQPVLETTEDAVVMRQTGESQVCVQEVEVVQQMAEEYKQDLWLSTEESLIAEEESGKSLTHAAEHLQSQMERDHPESGVANNVLAKGESQEVAPKTGAHCGVESEGEEFDIALEHPEMVTETNMALIQWDTEDSTDTEEEIEKSLTEAVDPLQSQTGRDQVESGAVNCVLAEGESQEDASKTRGNVEAESEGEEFEIALEDPEMITETNIATME